MFSVGDYIIYGTEGVCRVDAVEPMKLHGSDQNRTYYRLTPVYHNGTIFTPVDGKAVMRSIITRQELDGLLPTLRQMEPLSDIPSQARAAGEYYRSVLISHDCTLLLRLCITIKRKQDALSGTRKTLSSLELHNWRLAEDLLFGEFAFVLGIDPSGVKQLLLERMKS